MHRLSLSVPSVALAILLLSGCGQSPTAPGTAGATITGAIVGASTAGSVARGTAPSTGATVAVVGSGQSTSVDSTDTFVLTNVPSGGNVTLKLTGAGLNAQVPLGAIGAAEHVSVTISRDGSSCNLDKIDRTGADREELEGVIDGLPPTTPAGTFTIGGQSVQTDTNTKFTKGDAPATFADLVLGERVHVKGTPNATGVLAASVRIQDTNPNLNVEVEGTISGFSGTAASFQFMVNNKLVTGDATTVFATGTTFASLVNGAQVEVKGVLKTGSIFATKIEVDASGSSAP